MRRRSPEQMPQVEHTAPKETLRTKERSLFERINSLIPGKGILLMGLFMMATEACSEDGQEGSNRPTIESVRAEMQKEEQAEFIQKIIALLKNGVYLEFGGYTTSIENNQASINTDVPYTLSRVIGSLNIQKNIPETSYAYSITDAINKETENVKSGDTVRIPIYEVKITADLKQKNVTISVVNWLSGKTIFSQDFKCELGKGSYNFEVDVYKPESVGKEIAAAIKSEGLDNLEILKEIADDNDIEGTANEGAHSLSPTGYGVGTLLEIYKEGYRFTFQSKDDTMMVLSGNEKLAYFPESASLISESSFGKIELSKYEYTNDKKESFFRAFTDKYGNLITIETESKDNVKEDKNDPEEKYRYRTDITIYTPLLYHENKEYVDVPVDLSSLGLPDTRCLFKQKSEKPSARNIGEGKYNFFNSEDDDDGKNAIESAANGAAEAEKWFGMKAGYFIKNIYIEDEDSENGWFQHGKANTITLTDEMMKVNKQRIEGVSFHEAVHLLDNLFKIYNDKRIEDLMNKIPKGIFSTINESSYIYQGKNSGHSQDNEFELLSSFLNNVRSTNNQTSRRDKLTTEQIEWHKIIAETFLVVIRERLIVFYGDKMTPEEIEAIPVIQNLKNFLPTVVSTNL